MYKLIIVDDEARIRRGLKNCIRWEELSVEVAGEASNGLEALELSDRVQPDVIITDIKMPGLDGLEFIETLREKSVDSVIIIISGYNDFEYAQKAIRYQVNDYILKPIREQELMDVVGKGIEKMNRDKGVKKEESLHCKNIFIEKVLNQIHHNYNKEISIGALAESVSLHPNYLSSLFTEVVGEQYSKYLIKLRIKKAKELMTHSEMKIYEIAEKVGYSDFRHFAKLFKRYEGVSPLEYKNEILR